MPQVIRVILGIALDCRAADAAPSAEAFNIPFGYAASPQLRRNRVANAGRRKFLWQARLAFVFAPGREDIAERARSI
ncbi:MAG: hypothetical protein AAGB02_05010 [Pseudomonadota bacterium]